MSENKAQEDQLQKEEPVAAKYQVTLQAMKDMVTSLRNQMRMQGEPVEELARIMTLLKEVQADQDAVFGEDLAMRVYFFKDFVSILAKAVTVNIKAKLSKPNFSAYIMELPEILAKIMVTNIYDVDLVEAMISMFDHSAKLYDKHALQEANAILLAKTQDQLPQEEREWREKIEVGAQLDCIKIDHEYGAKCWMPCSVQSKGEDGRVKVAFPDDVSKCDRELSIYSAELALPGTRAAGDAEWRESIKAGDLIDGFDSTSCWYACTVLALETREEGGVSLKSARIAWRINHPEGDKTDAAGNKFFGWEEAMDEWLPLYSARIQRYQKHTGDGLEGQTAAAQNAAPQKNVAADTASSGVDDSMDLLVTQNNGQIFAVHRKQCRSDLLIRFINTFGALNGFEKIIERIEAENTNSDELRLLAHYVECLAKATPVYHKAFVENYFERLEKAARDKILRATGPQLRNTRKEKFDEILDSIYKTLLSRVTSRDTAELLLDRHEVTLEIGKLFLSQSFLERRIDGLKLVRDVCSSCSRTLQSGPSTAASANALSVNRRKLEMIDKVVQSVTAGGRVLAEVFTKERTHAQLVQRSEHVLRLLMTKGALSEADRELVWEAGVMQDGEMQIELLKVLIGAAADMQGRDREFCLDKLEQIAPADWIDRHIELATEICQTIRAPDKQPEVVKKGLAFLWRVALDAKSAAGALLAQRAALGFADVLARQDMTVKLEFADQLAQALANNTTGYLAIKILGGLLKNSFKDKSGHPEIENVDDMITYLETKHELFTATVGNFQDYMARVKKRIESENLDLNDKPENNVYVDKFMHSDQITERLEFIKYLATSSKSVRLRADALNVLWDELVTNSLIENDSKLMYQWLREICDRTIQVYKQPQHVVNVDDLVQFFHEKIDMWSKKEEYFKNISITGFHCIQSFFVLVNEIKGKLIKVTAEHGVYQGKHKRAQPAASAAGSVSSTATTTTTTTMVEKDGKPAKKFTSFNNQTGANFTSYSFSQGKKDTGVGTSGEQRATTYGPEPKPSTAATTDENPDDLEVIILVPPRELDGYNIMWQVATESVAKQVIESAARLLVDMHHQVDGELEKQLPSFDDMYIEQCFTIITTQLATLRKRTEQEQKDAYAAYEALTTQSMIPKLRSLPVQDRKIVRVIYLLRQLIRASEEGGTHNLKPHSSLRKGIHFGCIQVSNIIVFSQGSSGAGKSGEGYRQRLELGIDSHATIWDLKKLIGEEVVKRSIDGGKTYDYRPDPEAPEGAEPVKPIHPATIRIFQCSNSTDLKDNINGSTLVEQKFKHNETISAYKKSAFRYRRSMLIEDNPETDRAELTFKAKKVVEQIFNGFSVVNAEGQRVMTTATCIAFTKKCTGTESSEHDPRVKAFFEKHDKEGTQAVGLPAFEEFFIDACLTDKDEILRENLRKLGYAQNLSKLPEPGDPDQIMQIREGKEDMPRYKIAKNEVQFDVLMSMLSEHKEIFKCVQELIQQLATNPILYSKVLALNKSESEEAFAWSDIFDASNVNKMLYSLEIVEAILVSDQAEQSTHDWIKRFIELEGLKELQSKLKAALTTMKNTEVGDKRKYVEQLLRLLKIFVTSSRGEAPELESVPPVKEQANEAAEKDEESQHATPKDETKHQVESGSQAVVDASEITEQFLFGDSPTDGNAADSTKPAKDEKDKKAADDLDAFEHLRKVLQTDGLDKLIVERIDVASLQDQVIQVANLFLGFEEVKVEDRHIIESAMSLWATLLSDPNKGLDEQSQKSLLDSEFLVQGLVKVKDSKVRECFRNTFTQICKAQAPLRKELLEVLLMELKEIENRGRSTTEYFGLYKDAITNYLGGEQSENAAEEEQVMMTLFQLAIDSLKSHQTTEKRFSILQDNTLVGILDIISTTIKEAKKREGLKKSVLDQVRKSNLLDEVLYQCLFYQEGKSEVVQQVVDGDKPRCASKCGTKEARKAAFIVINEYLTYLEPHEMLEFLEGSIMPLIKDVERPKKWRHLPSSRGRVGEYVGIVNLGCICYMISMLQQFFMVPQFRDQLLKAVDDSPEELVEYKGDTIDDNLLRQLQKMFGYLSLSERHAYNPKEYCFAFKDIDGTPTKVGEQKDSQEFLNFFFDRLETLLKPTSQRDLLKDVFQGNQCSQLICQSCGKVKNQLELFYNLSLQVKDSTGIYDSLGKMVKGQTIEDFRCDGCDKKVNVTKRQLLADTPNVLVVHLQRIVFCFDTLQNDKVNTRFEFPNVLDLKDFSFKKVMADNEEDELKQLKEIADDDYVYRLVGVNVHVGTADHGHYYSLINTRRGADEPRPEVDEERWKKIESDQWKCFDDAVVKHFNFNLDLTKEAFGGEPEATTAKTSDVMTEAELAAFLASGAQSYGKSAYMLIYERKSKKNLTEHLVDDKGEAITKEIDFRQVEKCIPDWISELVSADNKSFLVDSQLFNDQFFEMMKHIFRIIAQEMVMVSHRYDYEYQVNFRKLKAASLRVAGKVLHDMLSYFEQNTQLGDLTTSLGTILTFSDSAYGLKRGETSAVNEFVKETYLADACGHFLKIMFTCTDAISRQYIARSTALAISRLFKLYAECDAEARANDEKVKDIYATLDTFMNHCLEALKDKECLRSWTRLEWYFKMLLEITTSCTTAAQYLLERSDIISDLIDFMLGNKSPRAAREAEKRTAMGGSVEPPFRPLFTLVSFLIRMVYTGQMDLETRLETHAELKMSEHESHKTYFLTDEAVIMLLKTDYLRNVINDAKYDDNQEFAKALAHLCYKNLRFTRKATKKLLKCVSYSNSDLVGRHLAVIEALVTIKDEFQVQRLEYLFGFGYLMHIQRPGGGIPQYGVAVPKFKTFDHPFDLLSGMNAKGNDDALLSALWKCKGREDGFTLACLQSLVGLLAADEVIAEYFSELPAPSYKYARYTDWIRPYLKRQLEDANKYNATEKAAKIVKVQSALEKYEAFLERKAPGLGGAGADGGEEDYIRCSPQPYAILEALEERVVGTWVYDKAGKVIPPDGSEQQPTEGVIELSLTQISCAYVESRPTGTGNLSLRAADKASAEEAVAQPQDKSEANKTAQNQGDTGAVSGEGDDKKEEEPAKEEEKEEVKEEKKDEAEEVVVEEEKIEYENICEDLLYRLTAKNSNETAVKLRISFVPKCPEADINLCWPRGGIKEFLGAGVTSHLMTLRKRTPTAGDGPEAAKLDIEVSWAPYGASDFVMGTYASASDRPASAAKASDGKSAGSGSKPGQGIQAARRGGVRLELQPTAHPDAGAGEIQTQTEPEDTAAARQADEQPAAGNVLADASDLPDAPSGMKACPFCTMFNEATASSCSICSSPI